MDLDPFCAIGIGAATIRLLDVFLLHCLLEDSPPDTPQEIAAIGRNQNRVAARGREPGLRLERHGQEVELFEWGRQLLAACEPIAAALDAAHGGAAYRDALAAAVAALNDPDRVPSARVLKEMKEHHDSSYIRFTVAQSLRHAADIKRLPLPAQVEERFAQLAKESLDEQRHIEASDSMSFESYRQQYLAPERLNAVAAQRKG
jgi:glutamate--cysteine ligase